MPLNFDPPRDSFPLDEIAEKLDRELKADVAKLAVKDVFKTITDPAKKEALFRVFAEEAGLSHLLVAPSLPTVAPALWLDREDKQQGLSEFITTTYGDWMGKGLTRAHIHKLDAPLYNALAKWLNVNKTMPEGVDLPTKSEQITRDLGMDTTAEPTGKRPLSEQNKQQMRVYSATARRQAQAPFPKP